MARRVCHAAIIVCALAGLAMVLAISPAGSGPDSLAPAPPGRLVDVGGYKLHLWCTGQGSPTVVLITGASGFSFDWSLVQPAVARTTRVCSCDRGGAAWSELGPHPRTKTQEAFNLWRALTAAKESGPYVLVGQSMGGDIVRLIAADHPADVAGMVLVDAGTPLGLTNLNGKVGTTLSFSQGRTIPAPREAVTTADQLTEAGIARIRGAVARSGMRPAIEPPFDKLPPEARRWRLWALDQPQRFVAMNSEFIGEEAERIQAENNRSPQPLAEMPLVVLSRDTTVEKAATPNLVGLQQGVARLSRLGDARVVPGAGHHIHVDRPEAVIEAIRQVVDQARKRKSTPTAKP